jgi:hypothetical protein
MSRRARWRNLGVLAVLANGLLAISCAGLEEDLVNRFFSASQRRDSQTVAALSMVAFPEDITSWEILQTVDLPNEEYLVPRLRQKVEEAEDIRDAQFKAFGNFRQENYADLRRIQNRTLDDPEYRFADRLGELQAEWDRQRQDYRDVVTSRHETEIELEREIRQVNKSLQRESRPEHLIGEILKKAVVVCVTTAMSEKTYRITLSRYELTNQFDAVVPARFIITDLGEEEP